MHFKLLGFSQQVAAHHLAVCSFPHLLKWEDLFLVCSVGIRSDVNFTVSGNALLQLLKVKRWIILMASN